MVKKLAKKGKKIVHTNKKYLSKEHQNNEYLEKSASPLSP